MTATSTRPVPVPTLPAATSAWRQLGLLLQWQLRRSGSYLPLMVVVQILISSLAAFAFSHFSIWSLTSRPSRMPHTTRLAPRTMSPAAKTPGRLVIIV